MRSPLVVRFLTGRKDAILEVAQSRTGLWAGFLFVLSAAFAREHDGADLLREPWRLAIPWVASLGVCSILFVAMRWILPASASADSPRLRFLPFLTCFWMTAPLAWFYAIPYERFLSESGSAKANFLSLGLVALWRVILITRVLSVLTHRFARDIIFVVLLVGDAVLLAAILCSPVPPLQIMGGVRLTDSEIIIQSVAFNTGILAFISLPIWIVGSLYVGMAKSRRSAIIAQVIEPIVLARRGRGLFALAVASVVAGFAILPIPQREQRLRSAVETAMHQGQIGEGIQIMSAHKRSDFPPVWEPPPRIGYQETEPPIADVFEMIANQGAAPWVQSAYVNKAERSLLIWNFWLHNERESAPRQRTLEALRNFPAGIEFLRVHGKEIREIEKYIADSEAQTTPATTQAGG